jgi:hypothetical protein
MLRNLLFASVFTLSAFVASGADAANGQQRLMRLNTDTGTFGFTAFCAGQGIPYQSCMWSECAGWPPSHHRMCFNSYNKNAISETRKHGDQSYGFTQGKFRSK